MNDTPEPPENEDETPPSRPHYDGPTVSIEEEMKTSYLDYAMSVIVSRAIPDLRDGLNRMRKDLAARKIPAEELRGNTITLSNFGMIGGKYAAPIVMPPTVAILGAGRLHEQVVAVDGKPAVHRVIPLSLSFDHRVVTGGEAARFLAAVIADLALAE